MGGSTGCFVLTPKSFPPAAGGISFPAKNKMIPGVVAVFVLKFYTAPTKEK